MQYPVQIQVNTSVVTTITVAADEQEKHVPHIVLGCKYIAVVHDCVREYSGAHPSICVCICASLSPTFVLE